MGLPEQSKRYRQAASRPDAGRFPRRAQLALYRVSASFQVMPPRALQGREIVLFAMRREFDDRVW